MEDIPQKHKSIRTRPTALGRFSIPSLVVSVIILAFIGLVFIRLATGRSLGIKSLIITSIKTSIDRGESIKDSSRIRSYSRGNFTSVVFLHHSVGYNLIKQGNLREKFTQAGFDFWDQGNNDGGLRNPDGSEAGYSYFVPGDNTDPDGLANILSQTVYQIPLNSFSGLMQHEIIILKSCYTGSNVTSDDELERFKQYYFDIRQVMDKHKEKLFILFTSPPLNPAETDLETAARARILANWLTSNEFTEGYTNLFVFDFFNYLAEDNPSKPDYNMLREAYRVGTNSHPNQVANEVISSKVVEFVQKSITTYQAHQQGND